MNSKEYQNIIDQSVENQTDGLAINQSLAKMYRNEKDRKGFIEYLKTRKENPRYGAEIQAVQNNINLLATQKLMLWGEDAQPPKEGMKTPEVRVSLKKATNGLYGKGLCNPKDACQGNHVFIVEERKKTEPKTFEQEVIALLKKHTKSPQDLVQFIK